MENLVSRAKTVLLQPKTAWETIKNEPDVMAKVITGYVVPLALIPAIASFIGYGLIGVNVPFFGRSASIEWGLNQAITQFVAIILGVIVSGWVISMLAPTFNTKLSLDKGVQLVAYSYTPTMVAGVLLISPSLAIIALLAGIYGLYILYLGFKPMTGVADDKATSYFVVSLLVTIGVMFVMGLILTAILGAVGLSAMKF